MNIRSLARKPFYDFMFLNPMMPQLLRVAISDSLTFTPNVETSGPRGHFNFSKFRKLSQNSGLTKGFKMIKEIKEEGNHITERLSISDLIQIGGAAAVEYTGGPYIELKVGRVDIEDEHLAADHTNYPTLDMTTEHIRAKYSNFLSDEEIVAMFGHRTLGFVSNKDSNKDERWTRNPWVFDNNYFEELLDNRSPYVKTSSDISLLNDDKFRNWVETFARNQNHFFDSFASAYIKISELGNEKLLAENTSYLKIEEKI
jgi:catalase (peroxidase I)